MKKLVKLSTWRQISEACTIKMLSAELLVLAGCRSTPDTLSSTGIPGIEQDLAPVQRSLPTAVADTAPEPTAPPIPPLRRPPYDIPFHTMEIMLNYPDRRLDVDHEIMFADESFAKYSEALFFERYAPDLVPWWWETHVHRFEPNGVLDRTIDEFTSTQD